MRVVRDHVPDLDADRAITTTLLDWTADTHEPALRVWQPPSHVSFSRRDTHHDGYQTAREHAIKHGYEPTVRLTGGRAVLATDTTISFMRTYPVEDNRTGLIDRYTTTMDGLQRALWHLNVPAQRGEPPDSFCPGNHSLQYNGKIGGLAQHVRTNVAQVSGILIIRDHDHITTVLEPIYNTLNIPFNPTTVGSIERAGGNTDIKTVQATIERHLGTDSITTEPAMALRNDTT